MGWSSSICGYRRPGSALERAALLRAKRVEIEADPNAEGFYLRMGARRTGESVYRIEGRRRVLPLLKMELPRKRPGTMS